MAIARVAVGGVDADWNVEYKLVGPARAATARKASTRQSMALLASLMVLTQVGSAAALDFAFGQYLSLDRRANTLGVLLVVSHVVSTAAFACSSYETTMYDTKCQHHVNGQRCSYGHPYWYNPVCNYDGCNNRPCNPQAGHANCINGSWLSSCRTPYYGNVNIVNGGSQCVWTDPYSDSYECPEPAACVAGTYSEDGKNAGGTKACQQCPSGKFQTSTGSSSSVHLNLTAAALTLPIPVLTRMVSLLHVYNEDTSENIQTMIMANVSFPC